MREQVLDASQDATKSTENHLSPNFRYSNAFRKELIISAAAGAAAGAVQFK
jgi:hypothetical protein